MIYSQWHKEADYFRNLASVSLVLIIRVRLCFYE
jgi:hypothetical protein